MLPGIQTVGVVSYTHSLIGAYYNGPKFKYQHVQGDFPIKYEQKTLKHTWSFSSKTLGHFEITILKYDGKSIIWFFYIGRNSSKKKIRLKIWTFSFQICFQNQFWTWKWSNRNTQMHIFGIFRLTTSLSPKFIPKADLK